MRNRSRRSDRFSVDDDDASYGAGASRLLSLGRRLASRPKDVLSLCLALAAAGTIVVNALFLQAGPHPAPMFAGKSARVTTGAIGPAATSPAAQDQITAIIEPPDRVRALQRALADFGYGQIKADGVLGPETRTAIERFEREHNLPVTGQMSERLARKLATMTGGPL